MAKTTTQSKAKVKTTKKPAARTRAAAAKTSKTTSKSAKPAAVKTVSTGKSKTAALTLATLRKLNLIKAFVFTALAVAAGMLMNDSSYAVNIGYQTKDELISLTAGKTAFVSATQSFADVQVRWLVVIILGLAALFSLLAATRLRRKYEAAVTDGVSSWRWLTLGITSALIVEVVALVSGVSDMLTLKVLAGLMLVTCALGWVNEKRLKQAGRPIWSDYVVSLFTGVLPWVLILGYAVSTWVWGLVRYPWFVYALYASTLVGFTLIALNEYKRNSGWKNNLVIERNYLLTGLATKAAFAAILIVAFQK
jgi:hypothetical protein